MMSSCTFELQAQASILTNVHACVHVSMVPAIPKSTLHAIHRPSLSISKIYVDIDKHQLQPFGGHLVTRGDVDCVGRFDTLDNRAAVSGSRLPFTVRRSHCAHSGASRPEQGRVSFTPSPLPGGLHASPISSQFAGNIRLRDYMASVMNHECVNVCITGCDSVCGL